MREKNNRFKSTKVYSFIYLCSEASPILPAYPYEFNTSVLIYHWFRLVAKFERWKEHTNKIHKSNVLLQHLPEIYVCTVKFFLKSIPTIAPATQNNNNSNENNSSYKPKKKRIVYKICKRSGRRHSMENRKRARAKTKLIEHNLVGDNFSASHSLLLCSFFCYVVCLFPYYDLVNEFFIQFLFHNWTTKLKIWTHVNHTRFLLYRSVVCKFLCFNFSTTAAAVCVCVLVRFVGCFMSFIWWNSNFDTVLCLFALEFRTNLWYSWNNDSWLLSTQKKRICVNYTGSRRLMKPLSCAIINTIYIVYALTQ